MTQSVIEPVLSGSPRSWPWIPTADSGSWTTVAPSSIWSDGHARRAPQSARWSSGPWPCPLMHASSWEKLNMFLDSLDIFVFWVGTLNIFVAFKGHMSTNCQWHNFSWCMLQLRWWFPLTRMAWSDCWSSWWAAARRLCSFRRCWRLKMNAFHFRRRTVLWVLRQVSSFGSWNGAVVSLCTWCQHVAAWALRLVIAFGAKPWQNKSVREKCCTERCHCMLCCHGLCMLWSRPLHVVVTAFACFCSYMTWLSLCTWHESDTEAGWCSWTSSDTRHQRPMTREENCAVVHVRVHAFGNHFLGLCVCNCLVSLTLLTTGVWVSTMTTSPIGALVSIKFVWQRMFPPYLGYLGMIGWDFVNDRTVNDRGDGGSAMAV